MVTVEVVEIPLESRCPVELLGQQALWQMGLEEFVQFVKGQKTIVPDLVIGKGWGKGRNIL